MFFLLIFGTFLAAKTITEGSVNPTGSATYRLHEALFGECYSRWVLPRENHSIPIEIDASFEIFSIHDVNERKQTIQLTGFLNMTWNDAFLQWNPVKFDNLTELVVPSNAIWFPKILLIQSTTYETFDANSDVRLHHDGTVVFSPHSIISLKCNFELTYYPFDTHRCLLQFEVWTYSVCVLADDVVLFPDKFQYRALGTSRVNSLWTLLGGGAQEIISSYGGDYSGCIFYVILKRKSLILVFNLLLPLILLSFLNLLTFRLPVAYEEKITLSITILVAFSVWQLMLNDIMPTAVDQVPILVVYIALFMIMSSASLLTSVCIIRISFKSPAERIPKWVQRLVTVAQKAERLKECRYFHDLPLITWKTVADSFDSLCFWLSFTVITLSTGIMILLLLNK